MARRTYLVSYDIADDKRRTKIAKTLEGLGDRVQYSVFFCDLNASEHVAMETALSPWIEGQEDQVMILDLGPGPTPLESSLQCLGRPFEPPCRVQVV